MWSLDTNDKRLQEIYAPFDFMEIYLFFIQHSLKFGIFFLAVGLGLAGLHTYYSNKEKEEKEKRSLKNKAENGKGKKNTETEDKEEESKKNN